LADFSGYLLGTQRLCCFSSGKNSCILPHHRNNSLLRCPFCRHLRLRVNVKRDSRRAVA